MPKKRVVLAVHGGAGIILRSELKPEVEEQYRSALKDALRAGYAILTRCKEELDANAQSKIAAAAAEAAVRSMEDCHLFNAGKGSVFAHDGKIRMDASIMTCSFDGECGTVDGYIDNEKITVGGPHQIIQKQRYPAPPLPQAGSVAGVSNVKNPISLAKAVMERTPHVMLVGEGATSFAKQLPTDAGVEMQPDDYFWTERRWAQLERVQKAERAEKVMKVQLDHSSTKQVTQEREKKFGTVGCVAFYRSESNKSKYWSASATSTGGMTNQRYHRVGDSPLVGSGTYANHLVAISCTGHGEWFIRSVAAHDIAKRLEYRHGYSSETSEPDNTVLKKSVGEVILGTLFSRDASGEQGGDGGAIALDKDGNFASEMNCPGMYHAWMYEDGQMETKIYWDE